MTFPKTYRCTECGKPVEVIDREEIEPCWNCIEQAKENERRKRPEFQKGREELERRMEEATEEIRKGYSE